VYIFLPLLEFIWVIYIIYRENVREISEGLYIATIGSNLTFNIYDCLDKNHLLSWNSKLIVASGYAGSLVFLEADGEDLKGHSILWMSCSASQVVNFCTQLNELVIFVCVSSYASQDYYASTFFAMALIFVNVVVVFFL